MPLPPNIGPRAFAGTAAAYARYRPPYPGALLDGLIERALLGPDAWLLDLACGPGRIALAIAPRFARVWAVDLEPEMIEVARERAGARGVENVDWRVGPAEDLDAPDAAFDLITIGEAFHRLDQKRITQRALCWLKPGGCLATLGGEGLLNGREPWQAAVTDLARRWTQRAFPEGWAKARPGALTGPGAEERVLREAGFEDVVSFTVATPHTWTVESVLGYLQSTSVCSRAILGGDFDAFAAALTDELAPYEAKAGLREHLSFGCTLGRKPG